MTHDMHMLWQKTVTHCFNLEVSWFLSTFVEKSAEITLYNIYDKECNCFIFFFLNQEFEVNVKKTTKYMCDVNSVL